MSTTKKLTLRRMDSPIMVQRGNAPDVDTYAKFLRPGAAAIDPVEEQKISIADVSTGVKCSVCSAFFASDGVVFKHMQKDHPQELFGSGSVAISASGAKGEKSPPATNAKSPRSPRSPRSSHSAGGSEIGSKARMSNEMAEDSESRSRSSVSELKGSKGRASNEMIEESESRSRSSVSPGAEPRQQQNHRPKDRNRNRKASRSGTARRLDEMLEDVDSSQRRATTGAASGAASEEAPAQSTSPVPFGAPVRRSRARTTISPEIDSEPTPYGVPLRLRSGTGAISDKTTTPNLEPMDLESSTRARSATSPGVQQVLATRAASMVNLTVANASTNLIALSASAAPALSASTPTATREYKCRARGCKMRFATRDAVKQHTASAHKKDEDNDDALDTETLAAMYGYSRAADR